MIIQKNRQILLSLILSICFFPLTGQDSEEQEREYPNKEENAQCFICHGNTSFLETSEEMGETIRRNMYPSLIIDTVKYYSADHWSFSCLDCHSYDYRDYPHPRLSKFETIPSCLDCHEGDETVAKYNFEKISEEFNKSHHTKLADTKYTCWSCHDPHGFLMTVRKEKKITNVVAHDNQICLKCHSRITGGDLLMGTGLEPLLISHEWIPETVNHFRHVRCIECHGNMVDDVLVAHDILPSSEAVKSCEECHSRDSRLLHSLYKYQLQEGTIKKGIFGNKEQSNLYVIGSNRTPIMNWVSIIIFGGILFFIMVHAIIRIINK